MVFFLSFIISSKLSFQLSSPLGEGEIVTVFPGVLWFSLSLVVSFAISCLAVVFITHPSTTDSSESFECGIDVIGVCRVPFAIHFFLIAVIFVVFDAEMLLSLVIIISNLSAFYWVFWWLFLSFVFLGLVIEFTIQTIDWNE